MGLGHYQIGRGFQQMRSGRYSGIKGISKIEIPFIMSGSKDYAPGPHMLATPGLFYSSEVLAGITCGFVSCVCVPVPLPSSYSLPHTSSTIIE